MNSQRGDSEEGGKAVLTATTLRERLIRQFPEAHRHRVMPGETVAGGKKRCLRTGFHPLDTLGVPETGLFELTSPDAGYGSGLVLERLLEAAVWQGFPVAVLDGRDALDAAALSTAVRERLLWVRCRAAREVLKAADFLLRDGNVRHVFLDLQWNEARELQRLPNQWWFRLRYLIEEQSAWVLAITPKPLVSSAQWRMKLKQRFTLEALDRPRKYLSKCVALEVTRQRASNVLVSSQASVLEKANAG